MDREDGLLDTPGQETEVNAPEGPAPRRPSPEALAAIVAAHKTWLKSKGVEGQGADLRNADLSEASLRGADLQRALMTGADLSRADLRGANLRKLDLQGACFAKADLTGASLTLANLRDVNLSDVRARRADFSRTDLCHADLSGASLQGADLSRALLREADLRRAYARDASFADADLSGCRGLLIGQLGGANLGGAILPPELKFEGLANVAEVSKGTQNLFTSVLLVCAYTWLTIASTIDAQLLNNAAPVASRLPILGTDIPLIRFYAVAPLLLLCMYIYFHMGLQRLWEELADLPAVFPDGRPLDKKAYPWLLNV
ncbi:MAG: pentapeptide repeat-containing protein, partial [Isosphaeraceae bacterium]